MTQPQVDLDTAPAQAARSAASAGTAVSGQSAEGDHESGSQIIQPSSSHTVSSAQLGCGDYCGIYGTFGPTDYGAYPHRSLWRRAGSDNEISQFISSEQLGVYSEWLYGSLHMMASTAQQGSTSTALPSTSLGLQWGSVHLSRNPWTPQQDYMVQPPKFVPLDQQMYGAGAQWFTPTPAVLASTLVCIHVEMC